MSKLQTEEQVIEEHGELMEAIEKAWWGIDTKTEAGRKAMPSPKQHKNLLGNKKKYLIAVLREIILAHYRSPSEIRAIERDAKAEILEIFLSGLESFDCSQFKGYSGVKDSKAKLIAFDVIAALIKTLPPLDKKPIERAAMERVWDVLEQYWREGCDARIGGIHPENCHCGDGYHLTREMKEALKSELLEGK